MVFKAQGFWWFACPCGWLHGQTRELPKVHDNAVKHAIEHHMKKESTNG